MVWINPLDPTTPSDVAFAREGDDRIRETKAGIEERLATLIEGWPDSDPLFPKGTLVGILADRPAAPVLDGVLYLATDTSQLFYSQAGAWVEFTLSGVLPPENSSIPAPTSVAWGDVSTCDAGPTSNLLLSVTWVNGDASKPTRLYLDGTQIHQAVPGAVGSGVPIDINSYGVGSHVLVVQHVDADTGQLGQSVTKNITIGDPCAPSAALGPLSEFEVLNTSRCDAGPTSVYEAQVGFVRSDPDATVKILRNGSLHLVLSPGIDGPLTDPLPGVGVYTYTATQEKDNGATRSSPVSDEINVIDPCGFTIPAPDVFAVWEDGVCNVSSLNEALLTWGAGQASAVWETEIYKRSASTQAGLAGESYALLATVGPNVRQFSDAVVVDGTFYEYYVRYKDPAGPTFGANSNSAQYAPQDLCA